MITENEKQLMKHFKVEELEERLEMKRDWTAGVEVSGGCTGGDCNGSIKVWVAVIL